MPLKKEEEPRGLKNFPSCPCCLCTWRRGYEIQDGGKSERRTLLWDWQLVLSLLRLSSWQQHAKCEQSKIFNIINQCYNLIYMENVFSSANIRFFFIQGSVTLRSRRRNSWFFFLIYSLLCMNEWEEYNFRFASSRH